VAEHVAFIWEITKAFNILTEIHDGKRPFGRRPRHRWEDNVIMGHMKIGCLGVDWVQLVQDRVHWHNNEPSVSKTIKK
jgi:hypothetical protein